MKAAKGKGAPIRVPKEALKPVDDGNSKRRAILLGVGALALSSCPASSLFAEAFEFDFRGHDSAFKDRYLQLQNVRVSFIPTDKRDIHDLGPMEEVVSNLVRHVYSAQTQMVNVFDMQERTIDGKNYYTFEYALTSPNFSRAAFATIAIGNGRHANQYLQRTGIDLAVRNPQGSARLLRDVSGAGKTTLIDVLAGRKTGGYIEGNISISGYPKNQETFARVSGYCEQNDIHSPFVTVHESLLYSAWLRLSKDVKTERKQMFVAEVMDLVELNTLKNALVGLPGVNGLSTEQRKRLTIAVELVANPSIIFMDEPTSGLDARAAAIVMRTVRNTMDTGRTVVCTIHQPSIDIFEAFDELLLMKRGGNVIYAGPLGCHSHKLVEYFEAVPGVPNITEGYNPATWMLDVSSTSVEAQLDVDFAEIYANSGLYQNQELIKELSTPAPGTNDLYFPTKYSQSLLTQCLACFWKQHWSYWRNSQYNAIRFFMTIVIGIIFGVIFLGKGSKMQVYNFGIYTLVITFVHQQQDLLNLLGATYSAVLFLGASNANAVQIVVAVERTVFYRERAAGMYSELPYAFAQVAIETIYVVIQTFIYAFLLYSMIGFEWTAVKFFYFYYFIFMCFTYFSMYGMMVVALTPNHQIAAIVMSFFFSFWNLFSSFLIPRP
ncbi:unnamed protein product [Camellia sinensis]